MTWLPLLASPFIGSFCGVLIRRLPAGRPVAAARSECEACHRPLGPAELVPILSFTLQRGRCRACGAPIAPVHLAYELSAMAIAGWATLVEPDPAALWADCVLGWVLLVLAWIDAGSMRLPDVLTLPLVVLGLVATQFLAPWDTTDHAIAAIAGYVAFRAVSVLYRRLRGREGLGAGDAKLLAASGAWVGLQGLPYVIMGAALAGLALALAWRLAGRAVSGSTAVPFGPCLAASLWIVRLYAAMP